MTILPFGAPLPVPLTSTINFQTGQERGERRPRACLHWLSSRSNLHMGPGGAHVVIDVTGYLAP